MTDTYLNTFYNMLFHPVRSFRAVSNHESVSNHLMFQALLTVIFISGIGPVLHYVVEGGTLHRLLYEVPIQAVAGMLKWLIAASVLSLIAYAFTGQTRTRVLLALSAFATLPWLFMAPTSLIQASAGMAGSFIGAIGALLIWLWSVLLFGLAVAQTYRLSAERTLIILVLPFVGMLIFIAWVAGFAVNIQRIWPG